MVYGRVLDIERDRLIAETTLDFGGELSRFIDLLRPSYTDEHWVAPDPSVKSHWIMVVGRLPLEESLARGIDSMLPMWAD